MSKGNSMGSSTNREGRHTKDDNSLRKVILQISLQQATPEAQKELC